MGFQVRFQVRLIHPLGDRLIDLPPREIDRPLVVGRAMDADIPVPSVNVSRRHCVLFMHEGRWVIEDGRSVIDQVHSHRRPGAFAEPKVQV